MELGLLAAMSGTVEGKLLDELLGGNGRVDRLATGFGFAEGPVWSPAGRFLLFNDIPGNSRWRWSDAGGLEQINDATNMANGMTVDADGALIVCEHATSLVVRQRGDGSGEDRVVLACHYGGEELNSPNDVVVAADGSIYFTDPEYGRMPLAVGLERDVQLGFRGVYRVPADDGDLQLLVDDFAQPNGLCFAPGGRRLYVNDSELCHVRVFDVRADGTIGGGSVFVEDVRSEALGGSPDGMKCDERGNLFVAAADGVWVIAPDGSRQGVIEVPETVSNLAWGGEDWSELYLTGITSLYRVRLQTRGDQMIPVRAR